MSTAEEVQKGFVRSFGTACFLAYFIIACTQQASSMIEMLPATIAAGICLSACFFASSLFTDKLDKIGPAKLSAIGCVLCMAGLIASYLPYGQVSFAVAGLATVIGSCAFFLVFGKNLAYYDRKDRYLQLCCTFLAASLFIAIASFLVDVGILILECVLLAASVLHLFTLKSNSDTFTFVNREESRKAYKFERTALFTTALTGMVWGIAFFECSTTSAQGDLCIAIAFAACSLAAIVCLTKGILVSEKTLLPAFASLAFIGIAPLPFVPLWFMPLLGSYLFLAFLLDTIICASAMAEVARFNQISPYWVLGTSLSWYFGGAFLGFILFALAFAISSSLVQVALTLITLLLIVWASSYVFQDKYPCEEVDFPKDEEAIDSNESKPALWQRKIDAVMEEYDLTARQQEVFRMLVRGRNASYIAKEFFISISTSKAHIHNIYQKLGIHSQQELINLVEDADPSPVEALKTPPPHVNRSCDMAAKLVRQRRGAPAWRELLFS